jgi:hypothetical protein
MCTPDGLLYCRKRDGGLGFPKLENISICTTLKLGMRLIDTADPTIQAILTLTNFDRRLGQLAKSIRLPWPNLSERNIDAYRRKQKEIELKKWSLLTSTGKQTTLFADDPYGNCWLYNPTLLKPSRFLTSLRLRSGTTADRITMNRARPQTTIKCRKCKEKNETLAHILGQCTATKNSRIRRHDEIRDFVAKNLATKTNEYQVIEEASVETPLGTLKPDLVVIHRDRVLVIDITVRHEDKGYLEGGYNSKVSKYTPLIPQLASTLKTKPGRVLPIVIGTRGAIPPCTMQSLIDLHITEKRDYITLALLALRNSVEIYHNFLDYDISRNRKR